MLEGLDVVRVNNTLMLPAHCQITGSQGNTGFMETMHIEEKTNTRVYNRSLKDLLNSLYMVGCFTGIGSDPPLHITIKGFP